MFCPSCRYEYVAAVDKCPDCAKKLVSVLPELPKKIKKKELETIEFVKVANQSEADILLLALKEAGIECMIKNTSAFDSETLIPLAARGPGVFTAGKNPGLDMTILINKEKKNEASEILKDLRNSMGLE